MWNILRNIYNYTVNTTYINILSTFNTVTDIKDKSEVLFYWLIDIALTNESSCFSAEKPSGLWQLAVIFLQELNSDCTKRYK